MYAACYEVKSTFEKRQIGTR